MQKLINRPEVPPGKFVFTVPETGFRVEALAKSELFRIIETHYKANGLTLPEDWKAQVEDRICQGLPPGWCSFVDSRGEEFVTYKQCEVTREMLLKGVASLATLVWETFKGNDIYVDEREANLRAEICVKCNFNVSVQACMGCKGMETLVNTVGKIKGSRTTEWDGYLKNCCKCGCRNEAIVHIKKEILISGHSEQDMLQYPQWCWKRATSTAIAKDKLSL